MCSAVGIAFLPRTAGARQGKVGEDVKQTCCDYSFFVVLCIYITFVVFCIYSLYVVFIAH